jgi:hypothetical protein
MQAGNFHYGKRHSDNQKQNGRAEFVFHDKK